MSKEKIDALVEKIIQEIFAPEQPEEGYNQDGELLSLHINSLSQEG